VVQGEPVVRLDLNIHAISVAETAVLDGEVMGAVLDVDMSGDRIVAYAQLHMAPRRKA
jgi:hypothetical protein